ncbi:hypothetical protein GWK47_052508 [Chionoecetes opilio]|uniref:Uncharacterized protein n=1 Tax=Chionoecetes opilio TaxID=41210 RepID=A0A8J4Y7X9_CHIOP|nr:hypothetical protein GWK47_052508 [Chionoecetes opilio]
MPLQVERSPAPYLDGKTLVPQGQQGVGRPLQGAGALFYGFHFPRVGRRANKHLASLTRYGSPVRLIPGQRGWAGTTPFSASNTASVAASPGCTGHQQRVLTCTHSSTPTAASHKGRCSSPAELLQPRCPTLGPPASRSSALRRWWECSPCLAATPAVQLCKVQREILNPV